MEQISTIVTVIEYEALIAASFVYFAVTWKVYWSPAVGVVGMSLKLTSVGLVAESSESGLTLTLRLVRVVPVVVSVSDQVRSRGHPFVTGRIATEVLIWPAIASTGSLMVAKLMV